MIFQWKGYGTLKALKRHIRLLLFLTKDSTFISSSHASYTFPLLFCRNITRQEPLREGKDRKLQSTKTKISHGVQTSELKTKFSYSKILHNNILRITSYTILLSFHHHPFILVKHRENKLFFIKDCPGIRHRKMKMKIASVY